VSEHVPIEQIKLYGERNTGTQFLRRLLRKNFTATSLNGAANNDEKLRRKELVRGIDDWLIGMIIMDRFDTHANDTRWVPENFGWKHTNPPVDYLKSVPERTAKTLFVILVKHPVFWMKSFQKRPYHSYFRYDSLTFHDFIRHVFVPTGRDNVNTLVYSSVVELYAEKIDGYQRLVEMGVRHELVRYEDLVADVSGFLQRLESKHGLIRREDEHIMIDASTKGDAARLADYKEKYRLDKIKELAAPEDYNYIIETFGRERLRWLGYPDA
jgi:hypothetical protein